MKKKRLLCFLVLSPFVLVFLLVVLVCGSKYFDPSQDEIHALIPVRAATQSEAVSWLQSQKLMCTPSPVSDEAKQDWENTDPRTRKAGIAPAHIRSASSFIFTEFDVKPRSMGNSWARNVLQYYLYFDAEGKLIASRSESICFGF